MSATRLLVLGVVRMEGHAHGYRVGRELLSWGVEDWANVKWGSIYHALRKLTSEGKLREFEAPGDEGERTSYAVTEEGEAEIGRLLHKALTTIGDSGALLGAGITLMTTLPRAEAVEALRERVARLEEAGSVSVATEDSTEAWNKPEHVRALFSLWTRHVEADLLWSRDLLSDLQQGRFTMADDSPHAFGLPPVHA
ncbi:PadR family transcriptional regulator [Nocardiopsis sp. HNM0947]|uniref:PadR family transcriptional regulator n=1 Tax=Nocardiopsis coralli TaxID=2772213 RepID=A0ABR9PEL9_9ACTN|nr:PadR family transcriptional regulator [Nocardiopsis coralli]MBE3002291.1 PadR family transcriptional regulator [Nocardiopsis coralli]